MKKHRFWSNMPLNNKKYQQSLSPEDKDQLLIKKADTERKQCKYLPPEKKDNMLETNAAAHKKAMQATFFLMTKVKFCTRMLMHIKRNENLFHIKIKTYLNQITLLHNTNIASLLFLIRTVKY